MLSTADENSDKLFSVTKFSIHGIMLPIKQKDRYT